MSLENRGGLKKEDMKFTAPSDTRDINQEKKFEVEIKREDIKGIKEQMERERNREGLKGHQSIAFEGAALARLAKEAPEAGIGKVELTDEDIKKCKERMKEDIAGAVAAKTKDGEKKGWSKENTQEEIKSEQSWITEFQKSYLKDILGSEKFKAEGLEVSKKEWNGMVRDLKNKIAQKDWHNVIPRAGHMHNLEPEKFEEEIVPLFSHEDKEGILGEIELLRKGKAGEAKESRQKGNPWELASRIRYVSEFLPELKKQIEINGKDWENMEKHLQDARDKEWGEKDQKDKGKKGDYWAVSYQLCNMKIIEKAIERKEIKTAKE